MAAALRKVLQLLVLLTFLLLTSCSAGRAKQVHLGDQQGFSAMLVDLRQSRVIFVGEFHDRKEHHDLQLQIIKALHANGISLAIGMEMFDLESQPALDLWGTGQLPLFDFVAKYQQSWSIPWTQYDSILLFARNKKIPLVALDAPGDIIRKVSRGSVASLCSEDLARLPAGASASQSSSYRSFMKDAFADHQIPTQYFDNFCQAQALRNSTMGILSRNYLSEHHGTALVVITGVGHAMRRAAATELSKDGRFAPKVVIPVMDGMFDVIEDEDADYFVYPE